MLRLCFFVDVMDTLPEHDPSGLQSRLRDESQRQLNSDLSRHECSSMCSPSTSSCGRRLQATFKRAVKSDSSTCHEGSLALRSFRSTTVGECGPGVDKVHATAGKVADSFSESSPSVPADSGLRLTCLNERCVPVCSTFLQHIFPSSMDMCCLRLGSYVVLEALYLRRFLVLR